MKYLLSFCFVMVPILVFGQPVLLTQGKVIDTLDSVELISQDRLDEAGEKYGVDYFVKNKNEYPIYVLIEAVGQENVYSNFPSSQFIVDGGEKVYMGWVVKVNDEEQAKWEMEWRIEN